MKMVNRLHAEGKKVNVWTVDKPADLLRMKMLA
jgi:glycerophosphoryl diester phosphodiesterase